jgi:aminoglycoside 3-N-acetyltransferase I
MADLVAFSELIKLFETVFEWENFRMPEKDYLQNLLTQKNFFVFVAFHEQNVIGGLTAYELPSYYKQSSEIYLYDLAVKTEFQRKGIGRALLEALGHFCNEQNYTGFFVQADIEDQHALDFYQSTGGQASEVIHYTYPII